MLPYVRLNQATSTAPSNKSSAVSGVRKATFKGGSIVYGKGKLGSPGKPLSGSFSC